MTRMYFSSLINPYNIEIEGFTHPGKIDELLVGMLQANITKTIATAMEIKKKLVTNHMPSNSITKDTESKA